MRYLNVRSVRYVMKTERNRYELEHSKKIISESESIDWTDMKHEAFNKFRSERLSFTRYFGQLHCPHL